MAHEGSPQASEGMHLVPEVVVELVVRPQRPEDLLSRCGATRALVSGQMLQSGSVVFHKKVKGLRLRDLSLAFGSLS